MKAAEAFSGPRPKTEDPFKMGWLLLPVGILLGLAVIAYAFPSIFTLDSGRAAVGCASPLATPDASGRSSACGSQH